VVGAERRVERVLEKDLSSDLRDGMMSRREAIWASVAASSSGVLVAFGSYPLY
jgi:hypothetical protein